jgi:hypothetical protein
MLNKVLSHYLKLAAGGRQYASNIWYKSSKFSRKKSELKFTENVHLGRGTLHIFISISYTRFIFTTARTSNLKRITTSKHNYKVQVNSSFIKKITSLNYPQTSH